MIRFEQVSYLYPETDHAVLRDVNLQLPAGEFALVVGASGAGKSTLLRCVNGLVPHFSGGSLSGHIQVNGLDPVEVSPKVMSRHVGFVFQDPEAQFVMDRVEDEIAFALENAAMPPQEMRIRVEEVLDLLDLASLRSRRLETLSGGERQRVAIASALALRPTVLVLDEPTSQLDPKSAEDVLQALVRLNSDLGLTILLAEHRLERVLPFVDYLIYFPGDGAALLSGPLREILERVKLRPPLVALAQALKWRPLPLTLKEGRRFAIKMERPEPVRSIPAPISAPQSPPYLQIQRLEVSYDNQPVLRGVNLTGWPGEIIALMGRNGAGKTTLLKSLVGLVKAQRGHVRLAGQDIAGRSVADICREVGYLPQDPNALLFADTVLDELLMTLRNHRLDPADRPLPPLTLLQQLGLADKAEAYPRDLSVGERQRVALGAIMITQPQALLLDEPTRGLDYAAKQKLAELLKQWTRESKIIVLVTHDVELAALVADRVALMSQGEIIAEGSPADVLGNSPLFAPQVARLFPGTGWLTVEDVLNAVRDGSNKGSDQSIS